MDLLMKFGPLKSFHVVKDRQTNTSKGFAFLEYQNEKDAKACIESLHGRYIGSRVLVVKQATNMSQQEIYHTDGQQHSGTANSHTQQHSHNTHNQNSNANSQAATFAKNFLDNLQNTAINPLQNIQNLSGMPPEHPLGPLNNVFNNINVINPNLANPIPIKQMMTHYHVEEPAEKASNVVCLANMINPETIEDDTEYEDIYNDIKDQIVNIGPIRSLIIPRKRDGYDSKIVGKVYVEFEDITIATLAKNTLRGQKFDGRIIMPSSYDPKKFIDNILE